MALEAVNSLVLALEHVILEDQTLAESLLEEVNSFRVILESSSEKSSEGLELLRSQIIHSANKAKDFIESYIKESVSDENEINVAISSQCLEEVKKIICLIKESVLKHKEESPVDFMEIRTRLLTGSQKLQLVSVVGMGGIGKTTLATKVYNDSNVLCHFDIRAWATVSQSYDMRQTLIDLLDSMKSLTEEMRQTINVQNIKESLYKCLMGRRYLIILDDVWNFKFWEDLKQIFPNYNNNASRILLTTRLENVAKHANSSIYHMHLLNEDESRHLFCHKVFGQDHFPPELKEIGKKILQSCGGLPLAVVALAGLLSKAPKILKYWGSFARELSSELIQNDEKCSKMLSLSYTHLPPHLKECFVYTAIFLDSRIRVSQLVQLWVAQGYIKQKDSESLEVVAYDYLLDLVDRGLIMVGKLSSRGRIKQCLLHDLVRDFCIKEAKNNMLFQNSGLQRVFFADGMFHTDIEIEDEENEFQYFAYLRYLNYKYDHEVFPTVLSSMFQNLQTLVLESKHQIEAHIWNMPKLRHVKVEGLKLRDPLEGESSIVLEHLQTLSQVQNFRCSKEVLKRMPNLKKLKIQYRFLDYGRDPLHLFELRKLESLRISSFSYSLSTIRMQNFILPSSLRKLNLGECKLAREDLHMIGHLRNLEVLKLIDCHIINSEWGPAEGEFSSLKYLLFYCLNLEKWNVDSVHFQSLQRLIICGCEKLMEIPFGIGYIPTLELIELRACTNSLIACVKEMLTEQREFGNDDLQIHIDHMKKVSIDVKISDDDIERWKLQEAFLSIEGNKSGSIVASHKGRKVNMEGDIDPDEAVSKLRNSWCVELISMRPMDGYEAHLQMRKRWQEKKKSNR